ARSRRARDLDQTLTRGAGRQQEAAHLLDRTRLGDLGQQVLAHLLLLRRRDVDQGPSLPLLEGEPRRRARHLRAVDMRRVLVLVADHLADGDLALALDALAGEPGREAHASSSMWPTAQP